MYRFGNIVSTLSRIYKLVIHSVCNATQGASGCVDDNAWGVAASHSFLLVLSVYGFNSFFDIADTSKYM